MTRIAARTRLQSPLRTPCNVAALIALGLLGSTACAAPSSASLPLLNNVILRGLVSDYRTNATFATAGTMGHQTLTITQLIPKIILDWNQFNLANGDTIQFVQPSSSAAVLNRIYDANPTTISGAIKANGQVYLVNQNGILFHNGTTIDTNSFFASTLNIDDTTFKAGPTTGGLFAPAFTGGYDPEGKTDTTVKSRNITIGGGTGTAVPTITAHAGGAVVIIAPVINNQSGVITSPDGQVILAAGNTAYLGFSATPQTGVRGMLVEVKADLSGALNLTDLINSNSRIDNGGSISADRGNVTLAGLAINQSNRVSASTAMLTNGSIYLQARTLDNAQRGSVTLSANSVTETPLDLSDTTTLSELALYAPYRPAVQITGRTVDVEGRITSPSGAVTIDAKDPTGLAAPRIYLGADSTIDASGAWSTASDASNLLTFKVTSNELKDAPDQKGGLLLGKTVTVDLRQSSPLLDLSGYQQNQARTLEQKAAAAGVVTLTSSGDVVQHSGSVVDVSGGGVHYTGVTEATTKLLGADGKLYDIMTAPEALAYKSIASSFTDTQARWGFSPVFSNLLMGTSLKRPDYVEGASGGVLKINLGAGAKGLVLDGTLLGGVTTGSQQTAAAQRGAALTIGDGYDASKSSQDVGVGDVTFQTGAVSSLAAGFSATTALSQYRRTQVSLSTDVFAAGSVDAAGNYVTSGFDSVTVNANGRITVPENVTLNGPLGGALTLHANQVDIDGHVIVPSGNVTAMTINSVGTPTSTVADRGVTLIQGAAIDTSGVWFNNATTGIASAWPSAMQAPGSTLLAPLAPLSTSNGGTITLTGTTVTLESQSKLDVSAGGTLSTKTAFSGGAAGSISLEADATLAQGASPLTLAGTLAGYGFGSGGRLSLVADSAATINAVGGAAATSGLSLNTAFFSEGGFQSYTLSSVGDLTLASGAVLLPRQQSLQIDLARAVGLATGGDVQTASTFLALPANLRKATSISFASNNDLVVQAGAGIGTDVGASVGLSGGTGVTIDGTVYAPGGTINVALSAADQQAVTPKLEIGADAILSTRGTFIVTPNDKGLVQGSLSSGGTISLSAKKAAIAVDAGSVIDVSGASQAVDMPAALGATTPYRRVVQSSNAGTVSIAADDDVTLAGALRGDADGSAAGGSFALTLNARGDFADSTSGRRIVVTQSGAAQPTTSAFKDVGISVDKLQGGGFDKLRLSAEDQIVFAGASTLPFQRGVALDSHLIQVASGANVAVSSAAVKLTDSFGTRSAVAPDDSTDPRTAIVANSASPAQASIVGTGTFKAIAQTLDVAGNVTISGASRTSLVATNDLRLSGRVAGSASDAGGATLSGSLVTAGDLTLTAAQVYPTTGSTFSVAVADGVPVAGAADLTGTPTSGGRLAITRGSGLLGDVLSAGGKLTVRADSIAQDGVLKAPLGSLSLQAGKTLTLGPTSVTSVSAGGLTIPYGETQNGVTWTYGATGSDPVTASLSAPPAKNIALNAPAVDVLNGAQVDISGGGDVAAIEWVKGSGGSLNALNQSNTYAIIPAAHLTSVPIDPDIALTQKLGFDKDSAVYNSIHIGAGGAVPAGDYVLLPGYYALLKGAYVVQLVAGSTYANLQAGQTASLKNGLIVVPGVMTAQGTDVSSSSTVGVVVRPGADIKKLADYTVTTSAYFAALAHADGVATPLLPTDAGQLSIAATQRLTLDGTLVAALPTTTSRSAAVDITADKIALVDQVGRGDIGADFLQIDAGGLSRLDASLLVGGVRTLTATGVVVTPTASEIVVANSAADALKAPELVLAATDSIDVKSGSVIESSGKPVGKASDITVVGTGAASGAILRVSNGGLVNIARPATDGSQGTISVEAGATLNASGSLVLDATRTTSFSGALNVAKGGALSLVSGSVSLGDTDGIAGLDNGLTLDNTQLAGFGALGTLSIKSYAGIALFGHTQIGTPSLASLVLDSGSLTGQAGSRGAVASTQIDAQNVALIDTTQGSGTAGVANSAAGSFAIDAAQITLGSGDKAISGFSGTRLSATGEILAAGGGSLQTAGPLSLQAARIASASGAYQRWSAQEGSGADALFDSVTINGTPSTPTLGASTALGSRLEIVGSTIADDGNIVMKSGSVSLQARGAAATDGVVLARGAVIDVGGMSTSFQGTPAATDAGRVTLAAANGAVQLASGSSVNLAAAGQGANAGTLSVTADHADFSGALTATSASGLQGGFSLDVAKLADFSGLNTTLNTAGLIESRDIRVRNGDVVAAAGDVVQAHHLSLESDSGAVRVAGVLDASAALGGGSVSLSGHDVSVASGARILASGTAADASTTASPYADGGSVTAIAEGGSLDFASGAVIDVRAGAKGQAGTVLLRAPRTAGNSIAATLQGQVLSQRHATDAAGTVAVEGNQVYGDAASASATEIDAADVAGYARDNTAFMGAVDATALASGIRGDDGLAQGNVHVRPAVEVVSGGDVQVRANWALTGAGWQVASNGAAATQAGSLVVRAAGDLTLQGVSVGNPDTALQAAPTWNIQLTSGADLQAANAARTQSASALAARNGGAGGGDLTLDSSTGEASIRTGTGAIMLSAGRDFVITAGSTGPTGVVYTTGIAAIQDPSVAAADSRFTRGGGDVTITAQRDAIGAGDEWMTEWYRSGVQAGGTDNLVNGAWWAYRPNFHDGVAALGGGNVSVRAGNDVRDLSAFTPTSAIENAGATLTTFGGGNLSVRAGNDIVGGQYLLSLGRGTIAAGGDVGGGGQASQLFLMGASGDAAIEGAKANIQAGGAITLNTIDNPSSLIQEVSVGKGPSFSLRTALPVLSYGVDSAVQLAALGGDIRIGSTPAAAAVLDVDAGVD
ncbi:MAG: filamentous hemagglutinin N-terminal domain-containing protein, partial [Burkholderiaceae bacterium]